MTITNLKELEARGTLQNWDEVIFEHKGRKYQSTVYSCYLSFLSEPNYQIFTDLGLDKENFCKSVYGYSPLGGDWPSTKDNDYPALTRCVKALYQEIDSRKLIN